MNILVTGGAGYIGSHVAYELIDAGHQVVILDNLSTGVHDNAPQEAVFIHGDVGDNACLKELFRAHKIDAVMHFAGSIVVPESVENPLKYYDNNTAKSRTLIEECVHSGITKFIFSSTAAVYGMPESIPVTEDVLPAPINPYGASKLMTEWMLRDSAFAYDFNYIALRYFNVAGADPLMRTGQSTPQATHLIKVATQTALGLRPYIELYGTDYPTADGTCIRDYIHVSDLARAHVLALQYLSENEKSLVLNCGYGHGYSVREVLESVMEVSGSRIEIRETTRRAGDPTALIANSDLLQETLMWTPRYNALKTIVETALNWEKSLLE